MSMFQEEHIKPIIDSIAEQVRDKLWDDAHCDGSLDWLAREHDYSDYDLEYGDIDWDAIDKHELEALVHAACKAEPVA